MICVCFFLRLSPLCPFIMTSKTSSHLQQLINVVIKEIIHMMNCIPAITANISYLSTFPKDTHIIIFMASKQPRLPSRQEIKRQLIKSLPSVNHAVESASVDISPVQTGLNLHGVLE